MKTESNLGKSRAGHLITVADEKRTRDVVFGGQEFDRSSSVYGSEVPPDRIRGLF